MEYGNYESLEDAFRMIPNDDTMLMVNAEPFVDYNVQEGGYLSENDDEYLDAFAVYAENCYIEVWDLHENFDEGWIVVESEPYPFAIPLDAEIEYGYESL